MRLVQQDIEIVLRVAACSAHPRLGYDVPLTVTCLLLADCEVMIVNTSDYAMVTFICFAERRVACRRRAYLQNRRKSFHIVLLIPLVKSKPQKYSIVFNVFKRNDIFFLPSFFLVFVSTISAWTILHPCLLILSPCLADPKQLGVAVLLLHAVPCEHDPGERADAFR